MNKRNSIRIELTTEQRQQVREFSGREISALELDGHELEQRIAPTTAPTFGEIVVSKPIDKASAPLF